MGLRVRRPAQRRRDGAPPRPGPGHRDPRPLGVHDGSGDGPGSAAVPVRRRLRRPAADARRRRQRRPADDRPTGRQRHDGHVGDRPGARAPRSGPVGHGRPDLDRSRCPAARGATESDAAYLARLAALDGTPLVGIAFARATAGIGPVLAPADATTTTRHLPVVSIDKTGPAALEPGSTAAYDLALRNGGSAEARSINVTDSLTGVGSVPVSGAPATLAPAATATGHASYAVPSAITNTTLANTGTVRWSDAAGNPYGPVSDSLTTRLIAARKLLVTKTDAASTPSGQFVVDYDISITNVGAQTITGVDLSDHLDPYTTLAAGSVRTSQGTVTTGSDPSDVDVAVAVGTIPSGGTVSIGFRARLTGTVPQGINGISNQATVTSDQLDPILSDDPEGPGAADPTFTAVVGTGAVAAEAAVAASSPTRASARPRRPTARSSPFRRTSRPRSRRPRASRSPRGRSGSARSAARPTRSSRPHTVTGGGPVTAAATVDPTILPNGTYLLSVIAVSSDGGTRPRRPASIVDGNLKLGRYGTTYQDLSVGVAGLPMQVLRTYDSFDKSVGDFGVGWNVELANFRVSGQQAAGLRRLGPGDRQLQPDLLPDPLPARRRRTP